MDLHSDYRRRAPCDRSRHVHALNVRDRFSRERAIAKDPAGRGCPQATAAVRRVRDLLVEESPSAASRPRAPQALPRPRRRPANGILTEHSIHGRSTSECQLGLRGILQLPNESVRPGCAWNRRSNKDIHEAVTAMPRQRKRQWREWCPLRLPLGQLKRPAKTGRPVQ